jgi:UPF0042 nucleotide-binding protein
MDLLIVTGMSGAGKSLALKSLEDMGFFCVDNLPSPMLVPFTALCENANPPIRRAAVTIDSRESLLSRSPEMVISEIKRLSIPYKILFLDARDDVLKRRYNETRKRHPLGLSGEAQSGVRTERAYLSVIRDSADFVLDTSDIAARDLSSCLEKLIPEMDREQMTLILSSFGYKRGVPVDADIVVDMRFVDNPFYYEDMRFLAGTDEKVRTFVLSQPYVTDFLDSLEKNITDMLPLFEKQDKHILRICFGCTGGRHRSVAAAEEMAARLRKRGHAVRIYHRDVRRELQDIERRMEKRES